MNSPGDQPDLDSAIRAIMAGRDLSALAEDLRRDRLPQAAPDGSRFGMHVNKPIKLPEPPYDPITLTVLVELEDANPEIWRRLELRGDQRLDQLHEGLQAAMGWNNSHLHHFNRPSERDYFLTEFDEHEGTAGTPEREVRLDQVLRQPGDRLNYEYDFGDGWEHVLRVTDVRTCATDDPVARCEAGGRACPPDDIGGIHRWNELAAQLWPVEDLRNLKDQYGPGLPIGMDPNRFDLHETNQAIAAALERAPAVSTYIEALDGAPTKIEPFEDLIRRRSRCSSASGRTEVRPSGVARSPGGVEKEPREVDAQRGDLNSVGSVDQHPGLLPEQQGRTQPPDARLAHALRRGAELLEVAEHVLGRLQPPALDVGAGLQPVGLHTEDDARQRVAEEEPMGVVMQPVQKRDFVCMPRGWVVLHWPRHVHDAVAPVVEQPDVLRRREEQAEAEMVAGRAPG